MVQCCVGKGQAAYFILSTPSKDCYEKLKSECHEGVHSVVRKKFDDGYQRFLEVSTQSVNIPYDSHPLRHFLQTADRKGLCHQLVNDLKFEWIKK